MRIGMGTMTVAEVLRWGTALLRESGLENTAAEARLLLAHAMGLSPSRLLARQETLVCGETQDRFKELVEKRARRVPLQHLLGQTEFFSLEFEIDEHTFIPRPETELLVEVALEKLADEIRPGNRIVIDLGTGSGAVAVSLAGNLSNIKVFATDISRGALHLARENARRSHVEDKVVFVEGDWWNAFGSPDLAESLRGRVDLVLCNPPYVTEEELEGLQPEVRCYEPRQAIVPARGAKATYQEIIEGAALFLKPGEGLLALEVGYRQAALVTGLIESQGTFERPETRCDLAGHPRVILAARSSRRRTTRVFTVGASDKEIQCSSAIFETLAAIIRAGGSVAFPTETVYGLGVNGTNPSAIRSVFEAKGRPQDNPLILHVSSKEDVQPLVRGVNRLAEHLMDAFWPGPLTLVLPKSELVPDEVTAGLDKVAVRNPAHPAALALIRATGLPLAAPSANLSGRPSPTTAEHVLDDLAGRIDALLDAGPTGIGLESTVLDLSSEPPVLLRPGGLTRERLEAFLGLKLRIADLDEGEDAAPPAPGMKYTHYAPKAELVLFTGNLGQVPGKILEVARDLAARGKFVGILATTETIDRYGNFLVFPAGSRSDLSTVAVNLFDALRRLDAAGCNYILAEGFPEEGLGLAIMNRLRKAASRVIA